MPGKPEILTLDIDSFNEAPSTRGLETRPHYSNFFDRILNSLSAKPAKSGGPNSCDLCAISDKTWTTRRQPL